MEEGEIELDFKAITQIETCWTGKRNFNYSKYRQPLGKWGFFNPQ